MAARPPTRGACASVRPGERFDCVHGDRGAWRTGRRWNITSLDSCVRRCRECDRCGFASFSMRERSCAWSAACDAPVVSPQRYASFRTVSVRGPLGPAPPMPVRARCPRRRRQESSAAPASATIYGALTDVASEGDERRRACASALASASPAPPGHRCPSCAQEQFPPSPGRQRVACVGDSITRGDASHEPGRGTHPPFKRQLQGRGNWPAMLQAALGEAFVVGSFSHGGRTAADGPAALRRTAEWRSVSCFRPDVVALMVGSNDAKPETWGPAMAFPRDGYVEALLSLARELLSLPSRPRLLLLVPPPAHAVDAAEAALLGVGYPRGSVGGANLDKGVISTLLPPLVGRAARVLASEGAPAQLVETAFGGCPANQSACCELLAGDGIHTSAAGSARLAEAVRARLVGVG